jgi:hypothetical protein
MDKELQRGFERLAMIFESGHILNLAVPEPLLGRSAFHFVARGYGKEWDFTLSGRVLGDLPETERYQQSAARFARSLEKRFRTESPALFFCISDVPILLRVQWPLEPLLPRAASCVRFEATHARDGRVACGIVVITHQQSTFDLKPDPFLVQESVVNSIRTAVDSALLKFYPQQAHPSELQEVKLSIRSSNVETPQLVDEFLRKKVIWLAFKRGDSASITWIADPWDADYLGASVSSLRQGAEILDAQSELQLDESREFASIGRRLLARLREFEISETTEKRIELPAKGESKWDVFISHATEDKPYVTPLAKALEAAGIQVWIDEAILEWGDDLRSAIDQGLTSCRFGIVVFSKAFLRKKKWTEHELNSLFAREQLGKKLILPIWHDITRDELIRYSPAFADRLAMDSSKHTNADIVESLLTMLDRRNPQERPVTVSKAAAMRGQGQAQPNMVAYAFYETKGENAKQAKIYVRLCASIDGWLAFENSYDDELYGRSEHVGPSEEIAQRFVDADRSLRIKGYVRMNYANLSGGKAFDL